MIFSCLSPRNLVKFSLTCWKAYDAVLAYNRIAYNINKLLLRYFTDDQIEPFRLLQDKTGTLISGSAALQFFDTKNPTLTFLLVRQTPRNWRTSLETAATHMFLAGSGSRLWQSYCHNNKWESGFYGRRRLYRFPWRRNDGHVELHKGQQENPGHFGETLTSGGSAYVSFKYVC